MVLSLFSGGQKVIDIVDLSDDEDNAKSTPKPPQPNGGLRLVPSAQLRGATVVQVPRSQLNQVNTMGQSILQPPVAIVAKKPSSLQVTPVATILKHPAPLPDPPKFQMTGGNYKASPPKPTLKISRLTEGK